MRVGSRFQVDSADMLLFGGEGLDSLASDPGERFSVVMTNPPFGKKSSIAIVNEAGDLEKEDSEYVRQDFWTTTKNKQLNFLQHARTLLKVNGRCAIVVPDNVLFEGRAGETVRRNLLAPTVNDRQAPRQSFRRVAATTRR